MKVGRKDYLIRRVEAIVGKFSTEKERRRAFSRTCGTVEERLELIRNHWDALPPNLDPQTILHWHDRAEDVWPDKKT